MRRTLIAALTTLAAMAIAASAVFGAITFHSGPTVTFSGTSATAVFNVSGLGNDPAYAFLDIAGTATYECRNKGNHAAPGQNPIDAVGSSGPQALNNSQKNGRDGVSITATLTAPPTPTAQAAGCPNKPGNWTVVLTSLTVTSATLRIEQPLGNVIFAQTYP